MTGSMSVAELTERLSQRGVPLAAETGLFIALEALEALGSRARVVTAAAVTVRPDGRVALAGAMDPAEAEGRVVAGVIGLLEAMLASLPADVGGLAERVRGGAIQSRGALAAELAALLVPFNRGAARRLLGRLVREAARPSGVTATATAVSSVSPLGAESLEGPADSALATVRDGTAIGSAVSTSLGGRLPASWGDEPGQEAARARARRAAWATMAVAVVALAAAVAFLVDRVRAAGA